MHFIFSILEVILASDLICLAWLASHTGMSHVKTSVNDWDRVHATFGDLLYGGMCTHNAV